MVALLIVLGVLVAFLTLLPQQLDSQQLAFHFDSRGPPAYC